MTRALRIQQLQAEAKAEATIACKDFVEQLASLAETAKSITEMGDAVPVGIRELASRIAPTAVAQSQSVVRLLK